MWKKTSAALALLSASYGLAQSIEAQLQVVGAEATEPQSKQDCKLAPGDFNITSPGMYPENMDFDPIRCLLYFTKLYAASIAVSDIRQQKMLEDEEIKIKNISGEPSLHASGIHHDPEGDTLASVFNDGETFNSDGGNVSGANNVASYDLKTRKPRWVVDLSKHADEKHGGIQDVTHDKRKNVIAVGSYSGSMWKISEDGQNVEQWWVSDGSAKKGLTGVALFTDKGAEKLLASDAADGQIYVYSTTEKDKRTKVELLGVAELSAPDLDGIYLLPESYSADYDGSVLLVSLSTGTAVLYSSDEWASAQHLGFVENTYAAENATATATVLAAGRILSLNEYFGDAVDGKPGDRSIFPIADITDEVDKLIKARGQGAGDKSCGDGGGEQPEDEAQEREQGEEGRGDESES